MEYIQRTNYFKRPWTWFKNIVLIVLIISIGSLTWRSVDGDSTYAILGSCLFFFLSIAIITAPVDDLAVDDEHFFHFRKSLLPFLSKVEKFDISKLKSIRSGGMLTQSMDVLEFFTFRGGRRNTIEITLTDDSYKSLDVAIYRDDLTVILTVTKSLMKGDNSTIVDSDLLQRN